MALTAFVGVAIFWVQNLYRDNRIYRALQALDERGIQPNRVEHWPRSCIVQIQFDRPFSGFFGTFFGISGKLEPLRVKGLTLDDERMTDETFMAASPLIGNLRNLNELTLILHRNRRIDWERCNGFDRAKKLQLLYSTSDEELSRLPAWREVNTLDVDIRHATRASVAQLSKFPKLEALRLRSARSGAIVGLEPLQGSLTLRRLQISGSRLSERDLAAVGQLQSLEDLLFRSFLCPA